MTTVDFYFDYSSPYSYIASELVEAVCQKGGAELTWQPVVIGGLFKANSTTPPHTNPNRARYLATDLADVTEYHGMPFKMRTTFLFNPILSLRATLSIPGGAERAKAVHALFRGAWAEDLDLGEAEVVTRLLDQAGLDGTALVEGTADQAIKDALRENTDRAVEMGFFGVPVSLVNQGEKWFWGHDRLFLLEQYLQSKAS